MIAGPGKLGDQRVKLGERRPVMQPYTTDTSPEAEAVQLELIRRIPPDLRAWKALQMSARVMGECKVAIARNNPDFTTREIEIEFIALNYGKELADAVARYQADRNHG